MKTKKKIRENIRQGDLLFIPDEDFPKWNTTLDNLRKDGIIREGEATGHHHRLEQTGLLEDAELYRPQWGDPIIVVKGKAATVVHEEHGPVTLKPNTTYRVQIAREFDIVEGTRQVMD